jgi:hypothetical protein
MPDWASLIAEAAITFVGVAIAGGAAGLVWAILQKRRELDLEAVHRFYEVYGKWFAVWKIWQACREEKLDSSRRDELLCQAADIEGQFESLLIKIGQERRLSVSQNERLGRFREGYQQLREAIEDNQDLPFRVQFEDDKVDAYVAFKSLAVEFASLAAGGWRLRRPTLHESQRAVVAITSWRTTGNRKEYWWRDPGTKSVDGAQERLKALTHLSDTPPSGRRAR